MPLRLDSLQKRWPTFDLPILPFLAPRVFTLWKPRRRYGSTQTAIKETAGVQDGTHDNSPRVPLREKCEATSASVDRSRISRFKEKPIKIKPIIACPENSEELEEEPEEELTLPIRRSTGRSIPGPPTGSYPYLWINPLHEHSGVLYGSWHTRLAAITYNNLPVDPIASTEGSLPIHPPQTYAINDVKAMREEILDMVENGSSEAIERFWRALPRERALRMWMELMMTTMERSPAKALKVLSLTFIDPYPPGYAVAGALEFIISHYHYHQASYKTGHLTELSYRVKQVLLHDLRRKKLGLPSEQIHLSPHSLWLLMNLFNASHLHKLYEILVRVNAPLEENTLIQFAYRLAKSGQTDIAFEIIQKLKGVSSFNSTAMLNVCAVILYSVYRDPKAYYDESTIFEFMVGAGLVPNVTTYSVLMLNSIRSGDHETAWKLHDIMLERQVMPNEFTYSILLNDAKRRMHAGDIAQVMSYVRSKTIVSEHLLTDVLHTIYLLQEEKSTDRGTKKDYLAAFKSMLPVYCDNFKLEPLVRIIPGLAEYITLNLPPQPSPTALETLMIPHGATLMVMITAYLRSIQNAASVLQFYHRVRALIYQGDAAVETMIEKTYFWDMILITFSRFPELTSESAHIMEDMLNPQVKLVPVEAGSENPDEEQSAQAAYPPSHITPKPSVYTWSILLKIFMDARQAAAGEKVMSIMSEHKIEPSIVTWGTLTNGYVGMRDSDMVADVVFRLEEAGMAVNDVILSSLKRVSNRQRFLDRLAAKQKVRDQLAEMKVQADIEADAEARAKAAEPGFVPKVIDEDAWLEEEFVGGEF